MKATIEKLLHTQCWEMEFPKINQLPLFLRGAYRFRVIEIVSTSFLAAEPVEKINLAAMRKHYFKLMELSGSMEAFGTEHKHQILEALENNGFRPKLVTTKLY